MGWDWMGWVRWAGEDAEGREGIECAWTAGLGEISSLCLWVLIRSVCAVRRCWVAYTSAMDPLEVLDWSARGR
jgi:hypothetical protein